MTNKKIFWSIALFLSLLSACRLLWLNSFTLPDSPVAENGVLDLRDWGPLAEHTLPLDGEWDFFPETFLLENAGESDAGLPERVSVPKLRTKQDEANENYGFGSYRLKILLDPGEDTSIGLRIPSISSASEIYINGELVAKNGNIAKTEAFYEPVNRARTLYYTVDETGIVDLVIHYANFDHPFEEGITQSITFGLITPFIRSLSLSINIVILSCVIYLIHAIYSLLLYFLGGKDKRLIHFSNIIICVILGTLIGERLLFEWTPLNYEWRTKSIFITVLMGGYSLFHTIKQQLPPFWTDTFSRIYSTATYAALTLVLLLSAQLNLYVSAFYVILTLIPCMLTPLTLVYATKRIDADNFFLLLAGVASLWSLLWLFVNEIFSIRMVSYPFDLMIALFCFSGYWFKRYFRIFRQSEELTKKLQAADTQKDEFLTSVAHEMRNPLHAILNITDSVIEKETGRMSAPAQNDLELLQAIGRHMSTLLNSLLDLEQFNLNLMQLNRRNVSLHNTAGAVLDMIGYMTDGKTLRLVNRIPEDFPLVHADQNRLIQILFNLLHNAVKYAGASNLTVSAAVVEGVAQISVSDDGVGIAADQLDTLFDRYTQASTHSNTTDNSGIGIGLNICQQLVNLHGGELSVSSVVGEGTVFTFTLPLAEATESDGDESKLAEQAALWSGPVEFVTAGNQVVAEEGSCPILRTAQFDETVPQKVHPGATDAIRLLAVDDDPVNLKILQSLFPAPEYTVSTAADGMEALALLERGSWDIVVSDVMMPHMSGYELTRRIRERFTSFELPVLLLTARGQAEDIVSGFRAGANDYVTKPIEGYVLKARINTLVHLKGSINERLRIEAALLQAQIQPHFLFNTINSIVSLAESDTGRMTELLIAFGDYLRYSFGSENAQPLVPIRHELDLLEAYLFIQKQRFGDRIRVLWDVDESLSFEIPPLSIQPIVENAIKHGILKRIEGGTIEIRIAEEADTISVTIRDDGVGMTADQLAALREGQPGNGIGIRNTNRRLKQLFGQELTIFSRENDGTTVCFEVPKE